MEKYYLNDDDYPAGVPSIITSYSGNYPSIVDRYYTKFYYQCKSSTGENLDQLLLFHSNRLCLVGLSKKHVAFEKGISGISYDIGHFDRSQNQVKGKHKKGAMPCQPKTSIAIVKCKDETEYKILSCITGKLIEVNERLNDDLEKLSIEGYGYIAVLLCKPEHVEKIKGSLISADDYAAMP